MTVSFVLKLALEEIFITQSRDVDRNLIDLVLTELLLMLRMQSRLGIEPQIH